MESGVFSVGGASAAGAGLAFPFAILAWYERYAYLRNHGENR